MSVYHHLPTRRGPNQVFLFSSVLIDWALIRAGVNNLLLCCQALKSAGKGLCQELSSSLDVHAAADEDGHAALHRFAEGSRYRTRCRTGFRSALPPSTRQTGAIFLSLVVNSFVYLHTVPH